MEGPDPEVLSVAPSAPQGCDGSCEGAGISAPKLSLSTLDAVST